MGYQFGIYLANSSSTYPTYDKPYYGNVHCRGDESSIWDCDMEHGVSSTIPECDSYDAVFLYCGRYS